MNMMRIDEHVSQAGDSAGQNRLQAHGLGLAYGDREIIADLDISVPDKKITAIIGPNACGKSTLLRALARLMRPEKGSVLLDGAEISSVPTRTVAQRLGLLPQTPLAPQGIFVSDLVARGRSPHQTLFQQWSDADESAVLDALEATETLDLANRRIDELSGGQRQRVWIAMALAQKTDLLLLDEPTTFLDLPHQIDVLNLVRRLNRNAGHTIVLVLHDLNLACRYADYVVAMRDGKIITKGSPSQTITAESVKHVFGLDCRVIMDPEAGTPLVIPTADDLDW